VLKHNAVFGLWPKAEPQVREGPALNASVEGSSQAFQGGVSGRKEGNRVNRQDDNHRPQVSAPAHAAAGGDSSCHGTRTSDRPDKPRSCHYQGRGVDYRRLGDKPSHAALVAARGQMLRRPEKLSICLRSQGRHQLNTEAAAREGRTSLVPLSSWLQVRVLPGAPMAYSPRGGRLLADRTVGFLFR